jgi:methyl-accepting chemotaxis protein
MDKVSREIRSGAEKIARRIEQQNKTLNRVVGQLQLIVERIDDLTKKKDVESRDEKDLDAVN